MPTSLRLEDHLSAIESAGGRLAELATAAGEKTKVPTCPAWDVRALVAHQSMVHRWATAHVTGNDPAAVPTQTSIRRSEDDLLGYYSEGRRRLVEAIGKAPPDLDAIVFLNDAPPAREFWARRQAHETTVHMVDALAAAVGRMPTEDEAAIDGDLAVDGIDELLAGFFTRGRSKLFDGEKYSMLVSPDDGDRQWHIDVAESLSIAASPSRPPRLVVGGSATAVYLGLWNRGDELELSGDTSLMERWRATQRIRWN